MAIDLATISVNLHETAVTTRDWLKTSAAKQTDLSKWKLFPLNIGNLYTAATVATSFQKHLFTYDAHFVYKDFKKYFCSQKYNNVVC